MTLSVITASLNTEASIAACLQSVRNQGIKDFEHIVVDGGSVDGTLSIIEKNSHERLRWSSAPDDGIAQAMNRGIAKATGEWLLFLQADDMLRDNNVLESLLRYGASGAGIVSGDVLFHPVSGESRVFQSRGWSLKMPFKTTIPHQGALIRRKCFGELGLFDEGLRVAMDYDWFLRAYWKRVPLVRAPLVVAEMSGHGVSSMRDWSSLERRFMEERAIHFKQAPSLAWKGIYTLYWSLYLHYRRLRFRVSR